MVSDNIRKIALGKIIDFDAVSLYPSAIRRGYYPANLFKIGEKQDC